MTKFFHSSVLTSDKQCPKIYNSDYPYAEMYSWNHCFLKCITLHVSYHKCKEMSDSDNHVHFRT